MHDDLYDGLADAIAEGTKLLLARGWAADRVLNEALVEGMRIVGIDFRDGILFVPEVLLAANAMKAGMALLRPLLAPGDPLPEERWPYPPSPRRTWRPGFSALAVGADLRTWFRRSLACDRVDR